MSKRSGIGILIQEPPLSQLTLVRDYPDLAARAFYNESPVSCPLSEEKVAAACARIKMRGNPNPPSWNDDNQLAAMDPSMQAMRHMQPFMVSLLKEVQAFKKQRSLPRQFGGFDGFQKDPVEITILKMAEMHRLGRLEIVFCLFFRPLGRVLI